MKQIAWGIIGCGDVTEVKSGPAFNKVPRSSLVAVMRRDAAKAEDYARRHQVPKWYSDANQLINDPAINAIYVATPPSSHEEYTRAAIGAGKAVYVEKPMSVDAKSARAIAGFANERNAKVVVAHYRREQPLYKKIKQLLDERTIGETRLARIDLYKKPLSSEELAVPKTAWRVDPKIAGGGLFNDLSPHQLDMLYYFFGEAREVSGFATQQQHQYHTEDIVSGIILFRNNILFSGTWCFTVAEAVEKETCEIIGSEGKISFSFFEHKPIVITRGTKTETITFDPLQHVQQPMIEATVNYFLDEGPNPCSAEEGAMIMNWIDRFRGVQF
jgi:predicted dehydrogenase